MAALFVEASGVYADLPNLDCWDEARDARLYEGPYPVVAHPPCARWSRLAGFTEARFGLTRGEDGGCFLSALQSVRRFGGVIEHPAYSAAWAAFGLPKPIQYGGWSHSLLDLGASCYVEQGRYGLPVKKATWLYAYGVELPELRWGYTPDSDGDAANQNEHGGMDGWRKRISQREAPVTPVAFRDALLSIARSAYNVRVSGQWTTERSDARCICDPPGWLQARDENCPVHGRVALPAFWDDLANGASARPERSEGALPESPEGLKVGRGADVP